MSFQSLTNKRIFHAGLDQRQDCSLASLFRYGFHTVQSTHGHDNDRNQILSRYPPKNTAASSISSISSGALQEGHLTLFSSSSFFASWALFARRKVHHRTTIAIRRNVRLAISYPNVWLRGRL